MKHAMLTLILIVIATMLVGADYYVNIYYAPNGTATGRMKIKQGGYTIATGTIHFECNIGDGVGGKYKASVDSNGNPLPAPGSGSSLTVICDCERRSVHATDSCSRVFTDQSGLPYNVGICYLPGFLPDDPPDDPPGI